MSKAVTKWGAASQMPRVLSAVVGSIGVWALLAACGERSERESVAHNQDALDNVLWTEQAQLSASDAHAGDDFGASVSISGDTALVGASGAAYVFVRENGAWSEQQRLSETSPGFGGAVLVNGSAAFVTADDAVFFYTRSANTWVAQGSFAIDDAGALRPSLALSGDTLVVGAPNYDLEPFPSIPRGAAYVLVQNGATWSEQARLLPSGGFPESTPCFGCAAAISENTSLIGSEFGLFNQSGLASVFERSNGAWTLTANLGPQGLSGFRVGSSVAVAGDLALVGMEGFEFAGTTPNGDFVDSFPGAVQAFQRVNGQWTAPGFSDVIVPGDWFEISLFGRSLALDGGVFVAGARDAAYAFGGSGADWVEEHEFAGAAGAEFGFAVALSNGTALVGAPGSDAVPGHVFVHTRSLFAGFENGSACAADLECQSQHCADGMCCNDACDSACTSCRAAQKSSGADGECGPVKAESDPRNSCSTLPSQGCGTTGLCDGSGACANWPSGTVCSLCASGSSLQRGQCNGAGLCVTTETVQCGANSTCGDGDCLPTCFGADCPDGLTCSNGHCLAPLGAPCTSDLACDGFNCVDGVCCNTTCDSPCTACNEQGHAGECVVVSGQPRNLQVGQRARCTEESLASPCHEPLCDGIDGSRCAAFVGSDVTCGEATCNDDGSATPAGTCDGAGSCSTQPSSCGAYRCQAGACLSSCSGDDDCSAGYRCVGASCSAASTCSKDGNFAIDGGGAQTACTPFKCESGACLSACENNEQCHHGFRCNTKTQSCERAGKHPPKSSHCSIGSAPQPSSLLATLMLPLALLAGRRSGRRRA